MKALVKRCVAVLICAVIAVTSSLYAAALTDSEKNQLNKDIAALQQQAAEIQKEIDSQKAKKNNQGAVLSAIRSKIANTQAQIDRCNAEINSINAKINANKEEIAKQQQKIADTQLEYKKGLRAIYMSNFDSNLKILLDADDFSELLQLTQLTESISSRNKKIVEEINVQMEQLNKINEENEKLIESQVAIRQSIQEQQNELNAQENDAAAIYNDLAADQKQSESDKKSVEAAIRAKQKQLEDDIANKQYQSFINPNTGIQWPVSGFYRVSAEYKSNDAVHQGRHNGIDIAGGGIAGQPIRAVADGYVTLVHNGCSHNYKKYGNCCGNGYGNYTVINHGTLSIRGTTANYVAYYAHASKIIVSNGQYVKQGQVIGYVGTTGWSTGYHLHFGVLKNGGWINPRNIL